MSDTAKRKIPGQNDPLPVELSPEEVNSLAQDLVNGKVESANDMVQFFIDKLKALSIEGTEATEMLRQGREQLAQLESRISVIRCEGEAYKKDLVEWHQRSDGEG